MNPEKMGVKVQSIKKLANEGAKIILKENKPGNKEKFIQEIQDKIKIAGEVISKNKEKKILIWDLDDSVQQDDIVEALSREGKCKPNEIRINNPRRGPNGIVTVTAAVPERAAGLLVKQRKIKMGWIVCRISEKIEPPFCNRCQFFGTPASPARTPLQGASGA